MVPDKAGTLRHTIQSAEAYDKLAAIVPAGSSAFVFPYMPVLGYVLNRHNPTSYSYLQPGMMPAADEARLLSELNARPPRFVLLQYLPDEQVLNVWPNSDRSRMRFETIREFVDTNYHQLQTVQALSFQITILEQNKRDNKKGGRSFRTVRLSPKSN